MNFDLQGEREVRLSVSVTFWLSRRELAASWSSVGCRVLEILGLFYGPGFGGDGFPLYISCLYVLK